MSLKTAVFIATSLDGYIAREDGSLDWLDAANTLVSEEEDCGFMAFLDSVDALVMGRNTFEKVLSFGQWAYGDKPVIVLSRSPLKIPSELKGKVEHSNEELAELMTRLQAKGYQKLYIDGGKTIQRFLNAELLDELIITTIPTLIGSGIRLFGDTHRDISLKHLETKSYDFGFTQSHYQVLK